MKTREAVMVERLWKRDGSTNVMSLDAAVDNLLSKGLLVPKQRDRVEEKLLAGHIFETSLAEFSIVLE